VKVKRIPTPRLLVAWASAALGLALAVVPLRAQDATLDQQVAAELPALVELYKDLHRHPELSYQEEKTAARMAAELRGLGFEVTERVGDYGVPGRVSYGVVGVLRNGDGPTVYVRTDLDGLPVEERTGVPYASQATGAGEGGAPVPTMHACGHDVHMTSWVGTARLLAADSGRWSGTLVMIGQPAEERGAGARAMLAAELYERFPRPDYIVGLHDSASLEAGKVGVVPGYALANVDSVDITVRGKGGHGAYPHTTKDPVVTAAQIITNLQTIVSRQTSPLDPAVITVGSIHGGTKHNIIPDEVKLQLTVRSYKPEVRQALLDSIRRVAEDTALAAGIPAELAPLVTWSEEEATPSTYNDPQLTERLRQVFIAALGEDRVAEVPPVMGGEDFGRFSLEGEIPSTIFWLGAVDPARMAAAQASGESLPSLHSSEFAPLPEPTLRTGVTAMSAAVLDLMAP
jgi:hippurate hydrolase